MLRAGIALAEHHRLAADDIDNDQAVCLGQGGLNGICQTAAHCIADDQAVDHDLHGMLDVLFEVDLLAQIVHVAVNAHTYKTGAAGGVQFLGLGAFAGTDYGGQHLEAGALRQLHHLVDHLINRLLGDLPPADRAVRHANPSFCPGPLGLCSSTVTVRPLAQAAPAAIRPAAPPPMTNRSVMRYPFSFSQWAVRTKTAP